MIIVSDTGLLRYLIEIQAIDSLPRLYTTIFTTPTVVDELRLPHFPSTVRQWAQQSPSWLKIERPSMLIFWINLTPAKQPHCRWLWSGMRAQC